MKFIIGTKLEMSQVFAQDGSVVPVTLIQAGPCHVTQVKTLEKDGYHAVQLGFGKAKRLSKPKQGHLKDLPAVAHMSEFRLSEASAANRGDVIEASTFAVNDRIHVRGLSKGRGFQGVVKRHGFAGSPATHGHKDQLRMPGSNGAGGMQHVIKGRRMAGHMGNDYVTVKNLTVIEVREGGILAVKGAVPGARNTIVEIVTA